MSLTMWTLHTIPTIIHTYRESLKVYESVWKSVGENYKNIFCCSLLSLYYINQSSQEKSDL
jgi:hypothetical protein